MKSFLKVSIFVGCFFLLGLSSLYGFYRWKNRVGYKNITICKQLKPGITISELEKAFGGPIHSKVSKKGERWLTFETPSINAGPISAEIDNSTGQVLTLKCFEDGPPTWTLK